LSQTVSECELLTYGVTLAKSASGDPCAFEGGTITITTPDGMAHDVTPDAGVPCIGGTAPGPCEATSASSKTVTYRISGTTDAVASASYTAAEAHTHMMDE